MQPAQLAPVDRSAAVIASNKGPLDYNLWSAGLALSGMINSAKELKVYIAKLEALAVLLPN